MFNEMFALPVSGGAVGGGAGGGVSTRGRVVAVVTGGSVAASVAGSVGPVVTSTVVLVGVLFAVNDVSRTSSSWAGNRATIANAPIATPVAAPARRHPRWRE